MTDKKVKFFNIGDLSTGFYLDRIKEVIDLELPNLDSDINTILELVNIIKFIENGIYDKQWSEKFRKKSENTKSDYYKIVGIYFSNLSPKNIHDKLVNLDDEYIEDFVDQFEKYDLGSKIQKEDFDKIIKDLNIPYKQLAKTKYLAQKYPETMKSIFLSNPGYFQVFLGNFTSDRGNKILVPATVSKEEMLIFCNEYIDSDDANINYLRILTEPIKGIEEHLHVDAKTKLKAKNRINILRNEMFKDGMGGTTEINMTVTTSRSEYDKAISDRNDGDVVGLVDEQWIDDHHDFPTLLNNIQNLYDLFSSDLISQLPSFPKQEMGVLETHLVGINTNNSYTIGQFFTIKQQMAVGKMYAFSSFLSKHGIRIEGIIDWFFTTYSKEEFGVEWLPLHMPSKDESKGNQTATLLRIEEHVRTQYSILVSNGSISRDLVEMSNTPFFRELQSHAKNKYVYLIESDDMRTIVNLLFSDQSSIAYINETFKGQHFVDLIENCDVKLSDLHEYQIPRVEYLINEGFVSEGGDGVLRLEKRLEIKLLSILYTVGVIGYNHIPDNNRPTIDAMAKKGMVSFGATLYSLQEQDYLNFILNNSVFDNSWGLRNSYQHGLPNYDDPNHYDFDNMIVMLILLTHVVKINEELTLREVASDNEDVD